MQQSGLFDPGESTASDIGDYSASSEDEWTSTKIRGIKRNEPDLKNEKPPSTIDTLPLIHSSQLPSFSGFTPKHMKQNESDNGDDIEDYSVSSENSTPNESSRKSSITILADVHLPVLSNRYILRNLLPFE